MNKLTQNVCLTDMKKKSVGVLQSDLLLVLCSFIKTSCLLCMYFFTTF